MNNYLKLYSLYFFFGVLILGSVILYLYRVGEYIPLPEVVEKQNKTPGKVIYGTALHANTKTYKKLLLDAAKPKIIALGSSRVMQFRQHMFLERFINMGGAMDSINDGINLLPDIINIKPDMVIIGADVWWFNDRFQNPEINYSIDYKENYKPTLQHALSFFGWMYDDKITLKEVLADVRYGVMDIGVSGQYKDGFGPDGSYYYTRIVTGKSNHHDKQFKETCERINNGNKRFEYNSLANDQHINNFVHLIRILEENNINVVVFFPPFAKDVNDLLDNMARNYKYIIDMKNELHENGIEFYDYTAASIIDSGDCEFIDGFHGGEVTYMRILNDLAQKYPPLNIFVDQRLLNKSINKHKGEAFIPDENITSNIEIDFLGLGCNK